MTTTTEAVNGNVETLEVSEVFSEADIETIELQVEELEGLGSEFESDLESISAEDVAEDLEAYFEGEAEEEGLERRRRRRRGISKRLVKVFTAIIKRLVKKIMNNPRARAKLLAACKKGPRALVQLLLPIIRRTVKTSFLRWLVDAYCPAIIARLYRPIYLQVARLSGMKTEEVEASPEFLGALIPAAIGLASSFF